MSRMSIDHSTSSYSMCAGTVVSPANAAYTSTELAHQVNDSGARLVLCAPAVLPVVLEATSKWDPKTRKDRIVLACRKHETDVQGYKTLDDLFGPQILEPHVFTDPTQDLAYLCYSSGTTGVAKGVMTTGQPAELIEQMITVGLHFNFPFNSVYNMTSVLSGLYCFMGNKDDIHLAFLPLSHIYGLTKITHLPVLEGQTTVIVPRWDTESCLSYIEKYRCSMMLIVPPVALLLANGKWHIHRPAGCASLSDRQPLRSDCRQIRFV